MVKSLEQACVGELEDAPPSKRFRFSFNPHKRFKPPHPIDLDEPQPAASPPIDLDPEDEKMSQLEASDVPEGFPETHDASKSKGSCGQSSAFCSRSELLL